jgi:hypothetical protein
LGAWLLYSTSDVSLARRNRNFNDPSGRSLEPSFFVVTLLGRLPLAPRAGAGFLSFYFWRQWQKHDASTGDPFGCGAAPCARGRGAYSTPGGSGRTIGNRWSRRCRGIGQGRAGNHALITRTCASTARASGPIVRNASCVFNDNLRVGAPLQVGQMAKQSEVVGCALYPIACRFRACQSLLKPVGCASGSLDPLGRARPCFGNDFARHGMGG